MAAAAVLGAASAARADDGLDLDGSRLSVGDDLGFFDRLQWSVSAMVGGSVERLPLELSQSRFVSGTTLPDTSIAGAMRSRVFGEVTSRPVDTLGLTLGLDSGLLEISDQGVRLDRRPFEQQVERTLLLGRVQAELQLGRNGVVAVRAGRNRPRVGEGAVFDAYAFGAEVDVDLELIEGPPVSFLARALLPDGTFTDLRKTSPLIDVQMSYRFGFFSSLTLMASLFIDTDDELADPLRSALFKGLDDEFSDLIDTIARLPGVSGRDDAAARLLTWFDRNVAIETEGVIAWTGLSGVLGSSDYSLRFTALGAFGQIRFATAPTPERVDTIEGTALPDDVEEDLLTRGRRSSGVAVRAFFGELESRIALNERIDLGTFALVLTGDEGFRLSADDPRVGAFLGLSPLLPKTAVFFGGTFGPDQATPTAFSVAPDGSGIVAGGLNVAGYWAALIVRLDTAVMSALVPSRFTGGRFYGVEVDLAAEIPVVEPLAVYADGGVLFPGSYFDDTLPAVQVVLGVRVDFARR